MSQHYSNPRRENDPHALPDLEIFYAADGWYWQACFPGLPDSEPNGPFKSEEKALADARGNAGDDDDEPRGEAEQC